MAHDTKFSVASHSVEPKKLKINKIEDRVNLFLNCYLILFKKFITILIFIPLAAAIQEMNEESKDKTCNSLTSLCCEATSTNLL